MQWELGQLASVGGLRTSISMQRARRLKSWAAAKTKFIVPLPTRKHTAGVRPITICATVVLPNAALPVLPSSALTVGCAAASSAMSTVQIFGPCDGGSCPNVVLLK